MCFARPQSPEIIKWTNWFKSRYFLRVLLGAKPRFWIFSRHQEGFWEVRPHDVPPNALENGNALLVHGVRTIFGIEERCLCIFLGLGGMGRRREKTEQLLKQDFKKWMCRPSWFGSLQRVPARGLKGPAFNSGQEHIPRLQALIRAQVGGTSIFLSPRCPFHPL